MRLDECDMKCPTGHLLDLVLLLYFHQVTLIQILGPNRDSYLEFVLWPSYQYHQCYQHEKYFSIF